MLKLDWGDAQVWMDTAKVLYMRNAGSPEDALRKRAGYPHGNELNVAAVCAGYAFELIYKVLVKVGGNNQNDAQTQRRACEPRRGRSH